ncbi:hypothetical protein Bpfe_028812 [Biomphalaria pfeifferi]|uniref:G-protein coupled receptors family 1 profile domain-containing protein n=1 Tax=Biomphalaria pfeifferi TaxID=112525 RepID=A0AAD8ASU8_BIOPF|nr:hypothetical protein Bpfe_028812 [Biomphalaria pfeifferi]
MSEFATRYNASNKWESKCNSEFETSLSTPSTVRRMSHFSLDTLEISSQKSSPRIISRMPKPLRKQTKAVVTIGSVVAVFTIFWMPPSLYFTVASQSLYVKESELYKNSTNFDIPSKTVVYNDGLLVSGCYMFSLLPAIINPFLYCRIKSVRIKVLSLLCGRH